MGGKGRERVKKSKVCALLLTCSSVEVKSALRIQDLILRRATSNLRVISLSFSLRLSALSPLSFSLSLSQSRSLSVERDSGFWRNRLKFMRKAGIGVSRKIYPKTRLNSSTFSDSFSIVKYKKNNLRLILSKKTGSFRKWENFLYLIMVTFTSNFH